MATKYVSTLTGPQMDAALLDMAYHNSEAYAVGTRDGVEVTPGDVTYQNNAKFYSERAYTATNNALLYASQAMTSAQHAADSSAGASFAASEARYHAANAATSAENAEASAERAEQIVGGEFVSYGGPQGLSDTQKARARDNINAADDDVVVKTVAQSLTEAQQGQARANIRAGGSNDNLLDNGWFTVNQRGLTSGVAGDYPADRWQTTYGTGNMTWQRESDGSITITPNLSTNHADLTIVLEQDLIAFLNAKTVTASVLLADGTILTGANMFSATGNRTFINNGDNTQHISFDWVYSMRKIFVRSWYNGNSIHAVKLELGPYSTLANDVPPDYGEELRKCQYYFRRIANNGGSDQWMLTGVCGSTNVGVFILDTPMRQAGATTSYSGNLKVNNSAVTSISTYTQVGRTILQCVTGGGLTLYGACGLIISGGGYLDISRDL